MEDNINLSAQERFNRDLSNYVLIDNDIYRTQWGNPDSLNTTSINKTVFKAKFNFTEADWQQLPEFEGYTVDPLHIDYRRSVDGKWNLYDPIRLTPEPGKFPTIEKLINHVFGQNSAEIDQVETFHDYVTLLINNPKQLQQCIVLYSKVRGTSKTAIAKLLEMIFKNNYTEIADNEFSGDFNMLWIRSLVINLDEPKFKNPEDTNRKLRRIITSTHQNLRKMQSDHTKVPFYGKFIITTNDSNFMPFEAADRRYWIREVPPFPKGEEQNDFMECVKEEVDHYVNYLLNERSMKYPEKADKTFWIPERDIKATNGFKKLVGDTKSDIEDAATDILTSWFISNPECETVSFRLRELRNQIAQECDTLPKLIKQKDLGILLRDVMDIGAPEGNVRLREGTPTLLPLDGGVGQWWTASREKFDTTVDIFNPNVIK